METVIGSPGTMPPPTALSFEMDLNMDIFTLKLLGACFEEGDITIEIGGVRLTGYLWSTDNTVFQVDLEATSEDVKAIVGYVTCVAPSLGDAGDAVIHLPNRQIAYLPLAVSGKQD